MEEKKSIKIKFKTAVILIIIAVLLLGICGANVYASTHGYGNVFFLIKYLITGERTEITGKNDLLSDRDITISYEPILLTEDIKIQIRNLQIKDNKAKLIMVINESKENDVTPLKYKVYNEYNKIICEQNSSNSNNQPGEYTEELILNEFKNEDKILNLEMFNSKNEKLTRININLETREVTIEGEKEAIEKISEIELKQFLGYVTSLEPCKDSDDERILFANSMLAQKEGLEVNKLDEVNKMLDATGYDRLGNPLKNAQYFKIVNKDGTEYIEVTEGRGGFEPNTVIDIKDISYCGGIYTVKFNYTFIHEPDAFNMSHLEELDIKDATVYFRKNEDTAYSTFKVVKFEENNEIIENVLIENNELIGSWGPSFAKENDKEISLRDIYGSGLSGTMNFETNGKYTEFIGVYSSENEDDLQGNYINNKTTIDLIANSGKKSILTIKKINGEKYIEKQIGTTNIYVYFRKTSSNNFSEKTNLNNIVTQLTPSGFAGSSLNRVYLYSNKEVYLIKFDGNGFEESNIKSKELIARNVDSISKSEDGDIYIKGGTQVKDTFNWIHFEDSNNIISNANLKTEYEKAIEAIKSKLLDKNWLKDNTLIKSSNGNSDSIDEQEYKFAVIKEQDTQNPVVVLVVTAEKILTENTFVIRYKNDNVSIKKVSEGHYQHIQTFTNEKYYATVSAHMGDWAYELIEVTSNDIGVMDRNHGKVGQDEYEYLEIDEFERNYNLQLVETDLNENNLNRFLNSQNNIITQLYPSGFAGSSLNIVELNSNKEVYLTILSDAGDRNNIASKELIAKNVNSISKTAEGDIVVKGGDKVKSAPNWIHFEK